MSLLIDYSSSSHNNNNNDVYPGCECGRCRAMDTVLESVCCREIREVAGHIPDCAQCITSSNMFVLRRLNNYALQLAYLALLARPALTNAPEIHRYTAYRQFVRWIWHRLGRRNRRVLLCCAAGEMRNAFPA
ncbi:uncharacterized protein LOC144102520 [Amblyomma americanum]